MRAAARAHAPFVLKAVGAAALVVALGFGAQLGWSWAQRSAHFALKKIDVTGNSRVSSAELVRLTGLADAPNLLQLDVSALERTLGSHPWVKAATVTRHLPSHLSIHVKEHQPAATVSLGELYLVDDDGLPFKRLQPQDGLDLPLITGIDRESYTERPLEAHERIVAALDVLRQWKPVPAEVRTSVHGVTVVQADGVEIRLGDGELAPKLQRLARIKKELQARKLTASVIRLDNRMRPDWVTVQLSASK